MHRDSADLSRVDGGPSSSASAATNEMAERVRTKDWSATPLGPMESWSPALRNTVSLILANRFPMLLWWGPDSISIYNDAYIPVLGTKHPDVLGVPVRECWAEIWHVLEPLVLTPLRGGPSTWSEDLAVDIRRRGFLEETHWTVAYSPVPDAAAPNGIGGVLATVHEITAQVLGQRRTGLLRELGRAGEAKTVEGACAAAVDAFARYPHDVTFALVYLHDGDGIRLAGMAGESPVSEDTFAAAIRSGEPQLVGSALVLPIANVGALVAGLSKRLVFDASYRDFLDLAASQLAAGIANARAYDQERRRAESLAELDRAKTTFFSNVSHEFRTPLTLMIGPVEDALADTADPLSPGQRQRQETVHRNALRLLKLVNSLLDFSRIEAGRVEASYEPTDIATLTAEIASAFRSLVDRASLTLTLDCPATAQPVFVDRQMWEKIVLNLISNAFKFTFDGGITVRVAIDGAAARLVVADTGTGIDAQHLPHVFDRFYRVDGARGRTYEGTGIGLALVRELVRLHGGTVRVDSEVGRGTTFTVEVPTGTAHLPADRIQAPRALASTVVRSQAYVDEAAGWIGAAHEPEDFDLAADTSARILVADDNADMRAYLERLLRPVGRVEVVNDGVEALEAIRRDPPDLVLSDVMMPNLDGLELVKALREDERTRTLPILLLSARAGEESRVQGVSVGADDYIEKPFSARDLVTRVRAQLQMGRLRREHADALRRSEERYRALVTASSDIVYRMSPDWSEMRHLVGRDFMSDTTDPNRTWVEQYIPPDDRAAVLAVVQDAILHRRVFELEHRVVRTDGTLGWTFSRAVPLFDENGEIVEWFGAATDISERKRAEEALRDANTRLADAHRRKDDFLAVLSHELRNPLAPIASSLHVLDRAQAGGDQAARAKRVIGRQVEQLSKLVNDLLDVTRITRGKIHLERQKIDLYEIVRRTVEDNREAFELAGVDLELAPRTRAMPMIADHTRIGQIIGNLLQNSARFTPPGGRARVSVGVESEQAVVRVADDGVGMKPETLERLFEPFAQAEQSLDRSNGGLGLGLALVKGLVELHGGTVSAHSEGLGKGTEMTVRLPIDLRAGVDVGHATERVPSGRRRVLIIEDNADAADSLGEALEFEHEVVVAYNGPDGISLARQFHPDVVLCDIGLPGMDGYDVARAFRADDELRSTRLVALTGYTLPSDRRRAEAAGFDEHCSKPPELARLEHMLASLPGGP
jgi:signal transduction histidine kinase/DNA-binding response OmpR family regulator